MKSLFILIVTCLTISSNSIDKTLNEDFQNCSAELKIENNRNYGISQGGKQVVFNVQLINTSNTTATFTVFSKKLKSACGDQSMNKSSKKEIDNDLEVAIKPNNFSKKRYTPKKGITLKPGESYNFLVTAKFSKKRKKSICRSIKLIAKSKDCNSISAQTVLDVYNPIPSDK